MADPTEPPDPLAHRRPIASRGSGWSVALTHGLVRAGVSANAISFAGLVAALGAGCWFAATAHVTPGAARGLFVLGAAGVALRLVANLLDGMVAEARGRLSATGVLWNEAPDRLSDTAILVGLGYAAGGEPALGWAAAWVAVAVAYVRAQGQAAGAAAQFIGPMAKQQRMAAAIAASVVMAACPEPWWTHAWRGWAVTPVTIALWLVVLGGAWTVARRLRRQAHELNAKAAADEH